MKLKFWSKKDKQWIEGCFLIDGQIWTTSQNHLIDNITNDVIICRDTGFKDIKGKEIYERDILSDFVETDEGLIKSFRQVFWSKIHGGWKLDYSFKQDIGGGIDLWFELNDFKYKIAGNIFENANLINK